LAAAGVEGGLQLEPEVVFEALLEGGVVTGAVVEHPLHRVGERRVLSKDLLHMREEGLTLRYPH
jgi:hypothetical protein